MEQAFNSARTRANRARTAKSGLAWWMRRVLKECTRVSRRFDEEAVHDLRVALRRCRTMADGLAQADGFARSGGDPRWRRMKRAGRRLFRRLGGLRDTQVMLTWITRLAPATDPVRRKLAAALAIRAREQKRRAAAALAKFDRARWRRWTAELDARARRFPPGSRVFRRLALDHLRAAHALHCRALTSRGRSRGVAYHQLRIGLKRFRYVVENFLPRQHRLWGRDMKHLQDLLGEVHDLDVLWHEIRKLRGLHGADKARWKKRIAAERMSRLDEYHARMTGRIAPWRAWRAALNM